MKKLFVIIPLVLISLVFLTACSNNKAVQNEGGLMDKKVLFTNQKIQENVNY